MEKRSVRSRQKRLARNYILSHAYQDHVQAENVNIIPPWDVYDYIMNYEVNGIKQFEYVHVDVAVMIERGEVLTDSRGRGSFQRV